MNTIGWANQYPEVLPVTSYLRLIETKFYVVFSCWKLLTLEPFVWVFEKVEDEVCEITLSISLNSTHGKKLNAPILKKENDTYAIFQRSQGLPPHASLRTSCRFSIKSQEILIVLKDLIFFYQLGSNTITFPFTFCNHVCVALKCMLANIQFMQVLDDQVSKAKN